ncbi:hypothetical protein [Shimia sagamensis]|uniref:Uncharacterized protein n=1 Tax=Shimia sagamensis TaxID=1566352 RepID=A0ABY1PAW3_9RHOB|nr:hypothetical protein [Shimia sagamensis]SMP30336.1 hypothetical protein SAMN06265373_10726 [Shimia sagamensis]
MGLRLPAGWEFVSEAQAASLTNELKREVGEKHVLWQSMYHAIARSTQSDDVLFALDDSQSPFVLVHLTWQVGSRSEWPKAIFVKNGEHLHSIWQTALRGENE